MNRALVPGCAAMLLMLSAWDAPPMLLAQTAPTPAPGTTGGTRAAPESPAEPLRLITHTQEYCDLLGGRVTTLRRTATATPPEVAILAGEGEKLCAQGHYRHGISRLRRALALLRDRGMSAAPTP